MDFSSWKKVCEDGKTCTLIHPKGHTMTIALKALPAIHREQIKRLKFDEGGKVPAPAQDTSQSDKQARATQMSQGAKQSGGIPDASTLAERLKNAWAKGGKVESNDHLASGGGGESEQGKDVRYAHKRGGPKMDMYAAEANVNAKEEAKGRAQMERTVKPKMKGLAKGGEVQYYADDPDTVQSDDSNDQSQQPAPPAQAPVTVNVVSPGAAPQPRAPAAASPMPIQKAPAAPAIPEQKAPLYSDQTLAVPSAVQQEQSALSDKAKVDAELAKNTIPAQQQSIEATNQRIQEIQRNKAVLQNQADALAHDMRDIDPQRFAHNLSNTAKTSTAIGLFLGGLGSAFGGHNYVSDWLDKQTDRDIEAQKQNNENKKTIWGAYHTLFGDEGVANDMTKIALNDRLVQQTQIEALKLGTPMAAAQAKLLGAQKAIEKEELLRKNSGRLGILQNGVGVPGANPSNKMRQGQPQAAEPTLDQKYQILAPGADNKYSQIMNGYDPNWSPKSDLINQQYTAAQQAEKVLNGPKGNGEGGIDDIMNQMQEAQGKMGAWGHIHNQLGEMAGALPIIGGAAGAATNMVPPTHSEKRFKALQSSLETDLSTALTGLMTPSDIHSLVSKFSPAFQDDEKDVEFKKKQIVNSIMKAVRSGALGSAKMLKKD